MLRKRAKQPGKRVSREMQRYQERLRSTSAELARFQSPLVLDEALERPAPHLPAQVADPAHVHARERERTPGPRADAPEGHEPDPLRNVGYIYDVPREDLDFLDGTPEPVQGSEKGRAEGEKEAKSETLTDSQSQGAQKNALLSPEIAHAQKKAPQRASSETRRLEKLRKMRARSQQRRAERAASPVEPKLSRDENDSVQHIEISTLSLRSESNPPADNSVKEVVSAEAQPSEVHDNE